MIKIGHMMRGENPEEQLKLERKRFRSREKLRETVLEEIKEEFLKRGDHPCQTKLR